MALKTQYVLTCESNEVGEFYVGPFRSLDKALAAGERLEAQGVSWGARDLESWNQQLPWLRQAEKDSRT